MLQRVQTLYLLAVVSLVVMTLTMPLAVFTTSDFQSFELYAMGLKGADGGVAHSTIYMLALLIVVAVLPIINIFLFKNRMLQIRLCIVEGVLLLGAVAIMGVYYFLCSRLFETLELSYQWFRPAFGAPIVAIFFVYLAGRAIFKDELLVRSVDRIR